mgnify:CR=1 FL=1
MHTLRRYQHMAVQRVVDTLKRNPVLVAPTGSGKTVMGCALVQWLDAPTLWLAHRKELIDQAAGTLAQYLDFPPGIIMAGYSSSELSSVQVASVQTLVRRSMPAVGLIVIDEAHHATAGAYQNILAAYPNVPRVGLTATPFRLDGQGLGDVFGDIVVAAYTDELVQRGVLHAPKVYAGHSPDLRGVKKSMGDYVTAQLASRMAGLEGDIVANWQARAAGKKTVVFAVNVDHSKTIVDQFRAAGVTAEHLDGSTPRTERDDILARLRNGAVQVVSNCMVLTEGWDLPTLECAVIARPTASLNLHLQTIGRVMRSADGKDGCIVLDHAGNHHMHGLVTRRLTYSLDGKTVGEKDPLGLRRCGACQLLYDPRLDACPECGWVPEKRDAPQSTGGALTEFREDFEYRREMYRLYVSQAEDAGFKPGWAAYRFHERFDEWPVVAFGDLVSPTDATREEKAEVFRQFSNKAAEKGFKPGWASHKYKDFFGVWPTGFVSEVRGAVVNKSAVDRANRLLVGNGGVEMDQSSQQEEEEWVF